MMALSDAERVELELKNRELASRDFAQFCPYVYPAFPPALHLEVLCDKLQQVYLYVASGGREGISRLMVFMPPQHWKSTTTSVLFPPFFLGKLPEKRVILSSYGGSLAMWLSRQARNLILSDNYRAVFGDRSARPEVTLSDDSRSIESWDLEGHYGGMTAAGVGGAITGKPAHLAIIDDPHKNRKEAQSEAQRKEAKEWLSADLRSRLQPVSAVVLIQTRWHPDDLSGEQLKAMFENPEADQWEVLCLPAIAEPWAQAFDRDEFLRALRNGWWRGVDPLGREPGEPLWATHYTAEILKKRKANTIGYDWVSLYQQRPRKVEGNIIKANQIQIIEADQVPAEVLARPVRYWDLSVGRSERAHPLSGVKGGRDREKRFYILDVREFSPPWADAKPKMIQVMLEDPPEVKQGIEVAGQQDGYYQDFRDDERLQRRSIVAVNPKLGGDKIARAELWATRIPDGLVYMVKAPWNEDFISQCVNFPAEPNDQVDGVSGVWQMLPGFVSWKDIPVATPVGSLFDPFGERAGAPSAQLELMGGTTWPG